VRRVCVEYAIDPQPDAKWKTVKAFSVLAPLLGGLGKHNVQIVFFVQFRARFRSFCAAL
jgi:hypothetical protein